MRSLTGKTALVTGAARGIGLAIAERLARAGVRLLLVDRDGPGVAAAARKLRATGSDAEPIACDLSTTRGLDRAASAALDRWAGVDLLVNNAGVAHYGATEEMTDADWSRLIEVNFRSPVLLTQRLLPSLLARPEAHVLNVGSVLGLAGMPRVAGYCATKFALVGFSESLRCEYGRTGLGVTTLCPGFVRTRLLEDAQADRARRGDPVRRPPAAFCVSVDRVARRAVRAVRRNEARVVLDPAGRWVRLVQRALPNLYDAAISVGRYKRIRKKRRELAVLADDRETALRIKLGLAERGAALDEPAATLPLRAA